MEGTIPAYPGWRTTAYGTLVDDVVSRSFWMRMTAEKNRLAIIARKNSPIETAMPMSPNSRTPSGTWLICQRTSRQRDDDVCQRDQSDGSQRDDDRLPARAG